MFHTSSNFWSAFKLYMFLSFSAVTKLSKFCECLTHIFLSQAEFIPVKFCNGMFCLCADTKTDSFAVLLKLSSTLKKKIAQKPNRSNTDLH